MTSLPPNPDQQPATPVRIEGVTPVRRTGSGEAFVWLTGMGLVIGLTMVAVLLGVILVKGLEAFWPSRIARLQLTPEAAAVFGRDVIVGHVLERRAKLGGARGEKKQLEYRVQAGNRDLTGAGFLYVDARDVAAISFPPELVRIERLEYGPAIARLDSIDRNGTVIRADEPAFWPTLNEGIAEAATRRHEIERVERHEIGRLNTGMSSLQRQERRLRRLAGADEPHAEKMARIESTRAELLAEYETLAAQARALREAQERDTLTYTIADGRTVTLPLGNVFAVIESNRLSFPQRVGLFFDRMLDFVSENPREANTEGGIFPAIFGTFVMTLILSVVVTPFGVMAAIYLREYAKEGPVVRTVRIAINNLAGVPSIVFGVFGLGFFVYFVGSGIDNAFFEDHEGPVFGTGGVLWASLTLALMTVPVVIVATEEALAAVSRGVREGSLGCGASKWQTIQRIVLPAAAPGIITGMILAMARGAGEVAPLMITGVVKMADTLPIDSAPPFVHLDRKFMHLGFHIYDLGFQSPDSDAARPMVFATTLLLIALVVVLNFGAILIRERLRRKYATGAF